MAIIRKTRKFKKIREKVSQTEYARYLQVTFTIWFLFIPLYTWSEHGKVDVYIKLKH
jgi:hypothetical protein